MKHTSSFSKFQKIIGICLLLIPFSWAQSPAQTAYIACGSEMHVIDVASGLPVDTIAIGGLTKATAVSPDGSKVYVLDTLTDQVQVIETATHSVSASVPLGDKGGYLVVSPDGQRVFVSFEATNYIAVIDANSNTIIDSVNIFGDVVGMAFSEDGNTLYAGNGNLTVIDPIQNQVIDGFSLVTGLAEVFYPVPNSDESQVYVTATSSALIKVRMDSPLTHFELILATGQDVSALKLSKDGKTVFVVASDNNILVIDEETWTFTDTISLGFEPAGLSLVPDGSKLWVTSLNLGPVAIIDVASRTLSHTLSVCGPGPDYGLGNFISPLSFPTSVQSGLPKPSFTLYPNPARGLLTLTLDQPLAVPFDYSIYDLAGRQIKKGMLPVRQSQIDMDIREFASGAYLLTLQTPKGRVSRLFVKEQD